MSASTPSAAGGDTTIRAWALARELVAAAPGRCAVAALLLLTAGVTEAFGLLLIVPLLQVAGVADAGGDAAPVVETASEIAASLGVPLNLAGVLAVFLGLAAIRSAAAWGRGVLTTQLRLEFTDRFRGALYAAVADASWGEILGRRRSDIQHALTDCVGRVGGAAFQLLQLAVGATLALVQFAVAVAVSPSVAAVAALAGLVLAAASRPLLRRSHELGAQLTRSGRTLRGYATDFLDGLKTAKSQSSEAAHVERFQRQAAVVRARQVSFAALSAGTRAALQFAAAAALAGLAWHAIAGARLTMPELALLALVFARVIPTALNLLQWTQTFVNQLPAYAEATALRDDLRAAAEPVEALETAFAIDKGIEARNLGFEYAGSSESAFSDVSFTIPANGILAVTGPSGSGKSTLADLLLGLLEPTRGGILVDGVPLRGSALRRWRRSTAYVAQEPFLLHESLRSNLSWARPDATETEMREALRLAAADFTDALDQGLDTVAGDRGERLSGGERQRVVLAAALLRKPSLLVLDEPTGQLDAGNEVRVVDTLRRLRGRTTIVIISHSEALLREADRVLTLNDE